MFISRQLFYLGQSSGARADRHGEAILTHPPVENFIKLGRLEQHNGHVVNVKEEKAVRLYHHHPQSPHRISSSPILPSEL